MQAEVIGIGSELTSGHTINTNAAWLARRLEPLGIRCVRHTALSDDPSGIVAGVREALGRSDVVITTGGLGPTIDDITIEAISRATDRPLVLHRAVARRVEGFYRRHHRRLSPLALRQARLPQCAEALPNPAGTAPGVWLSLGDRILIALPGVPREMRAIAEASVLPRLAARSTGSPIASRTLRTVGVIELQLQRVLQRLRLPALVDFGLYPHLQSVDVRLTVAGLPRAKAAALLDRLERAFRARVGAAVYGVGDDTLEAAIGRRLIARRLTLAVAESCTGGLVSDRLTNVPGSSAYLLGSVVAYHNAVKQRLLGVSEAILARHGAVSAPTARAMAAGVRRALASDVGLAITGIAGPSGGTARKPVGLVFLAASDRRRTVSRRCQFHGDREAVKHQAAQLALDLLRRFLG
jgi:nicotinamide-nucleotide amidase